MSFTTPVRRVTIFSRDAEASLRCYRDILGLAVIEDKRICGPGIGRMVGLDSCTMRILHLRAGESPDGLIGIYAIEAGQHEEIPRAPPGPIKLGQVVIVLYTDQIEQLFASVVQAGYELISPMRSYVKETASSYTPVGTYRELIFVDPDGVAVNLVQFTPPDAR